MQCILIKAGGKPETIELEGKTIHLDKMKELLGFDSPVACSERKIGNNYYDLWLDDEGLLKPEKERILAGVFIGKHADEFLVGNILVLKHDEEGNSIGLTAEEIKEVLGDFFNAERYAKARKVSPDEDMFLRGYFDNGTITIKAHSEILMYDI